jgi:hypothetical protein
MNRKAVSLIIGIVFILLLSGIAAAQGPEGPGGPQVVQANAGTGFSFQGYLQEHESPVNATCTFAFSLFDRPVGGGQLGVTQELRGVNVVDGAFAVVLNADNQFGSSAFNGQARWLEITVDCGRGATTLDSRQELLAVPYAQSLRPGATISGTVPVGSGALNLWSTGEGIHINQAGGDAIFICNTGAEGGCTPSSGNNGLEIGNAQHSGVRVNMAADGFAVVEATDDGVFVGTVGGDGLQVNSAMQNGINVASADSYGGRFTGDVAGVYAQAATQAEPDLILGGNGSESAEGSGIISSDPDNPDSNIVLRSLRGVHVRLNWDNSGSEAAQFNVLNGSDVLFKVESGGNVGIGEINPLNRLSVRDDNHQIALIDGDNSGKTWTLSTANHENGFGVYEDGDSSQVPHLFIADSGNVGIGTVNPTTRLAVNGAIRAKEITVETGWADFVFEEGYELMSLEEVEAYVKERGHLPDIPSAGEVTEHGVRVGEMESKLLQKIEELTLHLIAMDKRMQELEQENAQLNDTLEALKAIPPATKGE